MSNNTTDTLDDYELPNLINARNHESMKDRIYQEILARQNANTIVLAESSISVKITQENANTIVLADSAAEHKDSNPNDERIKDLQAEPKNFLGKAREVYKDKNIERLKDSSRADREELEGICLRPGFGEERKATADQNPIVKEIVSGFVGDSCSGPTKMTFVGISAQQYKTGKGIKVGITLQTQFAAEQGAILKLTAEMKRSDRLRELKPYDGDSDEFAILYDSALNQLKELPPIERTSYCIGRLHESSKRAAWFADLAAIGTIDTDGKLEKIILMHKDEEYEINLNGHLSSTQEKYYLNSGHYGKIVKRKDVPTIDNANWVLFK